MLLFFDARPVACTHGGKEKIYLRPSDQILFVCGAMASSAVSSVLYLRDAAGNHAETRSGAYIYYGDAASFHA